MKEASRQRKNEDEDEEEDIDFSRASSADCTVLAVNLVRAGGLSAGAGRSHARLKAPVPAFPWDLPCLALPCLARATRCTLR
jgi:hypothetical protein